MELQQRKEAKLERAMLKKQKVELQQLQERAARLAKVEESARQGSLPAHYSPGEEQEYSQVRKKFNCVVSLHITS